MTIKDSKFLALRTIMQTENIDGFLLPHGEAYNGDYNPFYVEGLQYLFGFSGSLGMGLITNDKAFLFIDGRYTIQAKQETAGTDIICDSYNYDNIAKALTNAGTKTLGIDKQLFSENQFIKIQNLCDKANITIRALAKNPLASLMSDEVKIPATPAFELPLEYAGVRTEDKRKHICEQLKTLGVEASFIAAADSLAWLLNIRGNDVPHFPVSLSNGILLADGGFLWFIDDKKSQTLDLDNVEILPPASLESTIKRLNLRKIHLDPASVSAEIFDLCRSLNIDIVQGVDLCQFPKACKNSTEIKNARLAHEWDGVAICEFLCWFSETAHLGGLSEVSAAEQLWSFRVKNPKCIEPSFDTISAVGANGAQCHYRASATSDSVIKSGDIYLVDSGGQYLEGTTDITRTVAVGGVAPDFIKEHFTRVLKGHIALARARFPRGITGGHLDGLARAPLWEAGLDFAHGTGHGVGSYLSVHEGPQNISSSSYGVALEAGMIISNEPGYYQEGSHGIRIENLVLVNDTGLIGEHALPIYEFETLTLAPIDKSLIKVSLLNEAEKNWLNAYHKRVQERLSSSLRVATRNWLESACAAI